MPIYAYVCTECGHEFDALQKISDDPLTECPACGKPGLRKRLTAPAFKLKGTGWYETDFKNSGKQAKSAAAKEGDGKSGAADAGKDGGSGDKKESAKSGSEAKTTSSGDASKSPASTAKDD
jgi:putative FmdB family regulatory protein